MMKALILAAGFGTRLRPQTNAIPKPLFPIGERRIIDLAIETLVKAGCTFAVVNTHHLSRQMERYLNQEHYPIPVIPRREPRILGTGGAIANVKDLLGDAPFIVINSDIVTDIDLRAVYRHHQNHRWPVTLVLTDDPRFNCVETDENDLIIAIHAPEPENTARQRNRLTFTGIHVIDPSFLGRIPEGGYCDIIDIYRHYISSGGRLKAFIPKKLYWRDIGTPERYRDAVIDRIARTAFKTAFGQVPKGETICRQLYGDGSDRNWYRLLSGERSLIVADHGLGGNTAPSEMASFVAIGRHLQSCDIPVPRIYAADYFSGLVFMEDLGDIHLQTHLGRLNNNADQKAIYQEVIHCLIHMGLRGAEAFNPTWAYQSTAYDASVVLEKECRYFVEAFLKGYLGLEITFDTLADEFSHLARMVMANAVPGFIHRDFQSRNIMIRDGRPYFIDFQGGRMGPVQYDMASLLVDPYVDLSDTLRLELRTDYLEMMKQHSTVDEEKLARGIQYCLLSRNLQILGAFGFLSKAKGKTWFSQYIPRASRSLSRTLNGIGGSRLSTLYQLAKDIERTVAC